MNYPLLGLVNSPLHNLAAIPRPHNLGGGGIPIKSGAIVFWITVPAIIRYR